MYFQSTDSGPFWMIPEEREQTQKDIVVTTKKKIQKYTKEELKQFLEVKGVSVKGNIAALQSACEQNGIPIQEEKNKVILRDGRENQREFYKSFGREFS